MVIYECIWMRKKKLGCKGKGEGGRNSGGRNGSGSSPLSHQMYKCLFWLVFYV